MAETYEIVYGQSRYTRSETFIGFNTECLEYVEKMCDKLYDALERFKKEKNYKWIHITDWKLQYYLDKRKILRRKNELMSRTGRGRLSMWSEEMDQFLKDNNEKMTSFEIAEKLDVSETSVRNRRTKLGLICVRKK